MVVPDILSFFWILMNNRRKKPAYIVSYESWDIQRGNAPPYPSFCNFHKVYSSRGIIPIPVPGSGSTIILHQMTPGPFWGFILPERVIIMDTVRTGNLHPCTALDTIPETTRPTPVIIAFSTAVITVAPAPDETPVRSGNILSGCPRRNYF